MIPQFQVGGYRIDLIVQGMEGSLAVECDGDAWHGPDRYDEDMARERDLTRSGWEFWRIRESVFRLNPDEALEDLWELLERRGVYPVTSDGMRHEVTRQTAGPSPAHERLEESVTAEDDPTVHLAEEREPPSQIEAGHDPSEVSAVIACSDRISSDGPAQPTQSRPQAVGRLAPYVAWEPTGAVPDPRTARQSQLIALLSEVVDREGPVVAIRAYRLINGASGSLRLTSPALRALSTACATAIRTGVLTGENSQALEGLEWLVLRRPSSPDVVRRERGPRVLDELPLDEITAMIRTLRESAPAVEAQILKRLVLQQLGLVRLTRKVNEFLDRCLALESRES